MIISASVNFRTLEDSVMKDSILVNPTNVATMLNAHQVPTTKTLPAPVIWVIPDVSASRTWMNVWFPNLVEMELLAETPMVLTSVCALKVTKGRIAVSTRMIVLPILVKTVVHVWMKSASLHVCA